jgi:hypothetical protein
MSRGIFVICSTLVASLLAGVGVAQATIVEAMTTAKMTSRADLIVRGQVVAQKSQWDDSHGRIFTDVTLQVAETYKGAQQKTIVIRNLGGVVDGIGMRTIGEVQFGGREEVFVFLRQTAMGSTIPIYQTIGMAQGKMTILHQGGVAHVMSTAGGATLATVDAAGNTQLVDSGSPQLRPLADLVAEVKQLLKAAPAKSGPQK